MINGQYSYLMSGSDGGKSFSVMMEGRCSRSWQTGVQVIKGPWEISSILSIFVFKEGTGLPMQTICWGFRTAPVYKGRLRRSLACESCIAV